MVNFSGFCDGQRRPSGGAKTTNFFLVINLRHKNNNSTFFFGPFPGLRAPPKKTGPGGPDLARPKAARKSRLFPDNCRIFFSRSTTFPKKLRIPAVSTLPEAGTWRAEDPGFFPENSDFFGQLITFSKKFRKSRGSRPVGTAAAGPRIKIRRITV